MTVEVEQSLLALADEFLCDVKSRHPEGLDFDSAINEFRRLAEANGTSEERIEELVALISPEEEVPEFIRSGLVLQSCLTYLLDQPLTGRGHSSHHAETVVYKFLREHEAELVEKHGLWP